MRILILSEPYPPVNPGGAGKLCGMLVKELKKAHPHAEFHVVCTDNDITVREELPEAVIHRLQVPYSGWSAKTFEDRKSIVLPYLMNLHREAPFDLVHDVGGFLYFEVFRLFCLYTSVPGITHLLLLLQPYLAARGYKGFIQKMFAELQQLQCKNSRAVILTSSEEEILYRQTINADSRHHIIFNGIEPIVLPPAETTHHTQEAIQVFIGGRVTDPVKGYERGVAFIEKIKAQTGLPVQLATIDYSRVQEKNGGEKGVSGRIDNSLFYRVLFEADIVLCPSHYEAFGLIALEALSLGTSVLASNTGGYKDIINVYGNGMLLNDADWEQPGAAIVNFFSNRLFTPRNKKNSHLPPQFNIACTAGQIFELYKTLLN